MKVGSGFTTSDVLRSLHAVLSERYKEQLATLPIKPAVRSALVDGYKDGVTAAFGELAHMDIVCVVTDAELVAATGGSVNIPK